MSPKAKRVWLGVGLLHVGSMGMLLTVDAVARWSPALLEWARPRVVAGAAFEAVIFDGLAIAWMVRALVRRHRARAGGA